MQFIYIYIIVYRNSMEFHSFSAKKTTHRFHAIYTYPIVGITNAIVFCLLLVRDFVLSTGKNQVQCFSSKHNIISA